MTPTPHDALVRSILGQPAYAAAELRVVLPPEITAALRLETLTPVDGAFIDAALDASHADLLFTAALRREEPRRALLLLEHQSTPDDRMAWRLLEYQLRIWERWRADHPDESQVPPIVTVLLHHGRRPWPSPASFATVMGLASGTREALGRRLLDFDFVIDDLATQDDAALLSRNCDPVVRLLLLALKNSRSHPRLHELMAEAFATHRQALLAPAAEPALLRLVRYVLETDEAPPDRIRAALKAALRPEPLPGLVETAMPTAADVLRAEALQEALLDQLEQKFGAIDAATRGHVLAAGKEQLREWMHRLVRAATLEAIFAS